MLWYIYAVEYYTVVKKDQALIKLREISQSEKDECHVISLICAI